MRIKICLIAAVFGIAVASGLWESLSSRQNNEGRKNEQSGMKP